MLLGSQNIISPITLQGSQAMMDTAIEVRGGAVLVVAGAGHGVAVLATGAAKVALAAAAGLGATVMAGVLNGRRAERVARAEPVGGATVEVEAEAEAVVADRVGPGAGHGARVGHAVAKGAVAGGEAEDGVALGAGAAAPVVVVAEVAMAPAGAAAVASTVKSNQVIVGLRRRTLLSWRWPDDVKKSRIRLYSLQSQF